MNAVFFDRDDTLLMDTPDYCISSIDKIKLFPDTLQALKELSVLDVPVFIISNQEVIAQNRITEEEFWTIHREVIKQLEASGVKITKTYICPHTAEDNCSCRKPSPKMLLDASEEFTIDLQRSWFVGDRITDVFAGKSAGTKTILVKTAQVPNNSNEADYVAPNLLDAVRHIITEVA